MKKIALILAGLFFTGMAMAQSGNHWTVITGTQYNMTVKGIIVIDGVTQANDQLEIGAFCGDECRGSRKAALFPPTGEYPVMLTVVSNIYSGETITFRIYDHASQQELDLVSGSTLSFEHNTNQGAMNSWFPFYFTSPEPPAFHFTTAGNWSTASNWQGGALPGASDVVIIDADCTLDQNAEVADLTVSDGCTLTLQGGKTLIVTGDLTNTVATGLVLKDGAQLINTSANVAATADKDIVGYSTSNPDGWYTIASPMDEMTIEGSDFLTPEYDLYRYNEANPNGLEWENYKYDGNSDFTVFENGRGYLYANNNSFSPSFTGTLNTTDIIRQITYTESPSALSGFNLIGNPFPHTIYKGAGGAIDNSNLASGYYTLTNEGVWRVHTYEEAIMPGQGILVKTTTTTPLTIAKNTAVATAESSGAKAGVSRMRVSLEGDTGNDCAFVYFTQGTGLNKMEGFSDRIPSLWIRNNGSDYAIAHIDSNYESLDVYFSNKLNADYTLRVNAEDTNFKYLRLIDNLTGNVVDLLQQPEYTFHASGNEMEARFKLVFKVMTGIDENSCEDDLAYINNGNIVINGTGMVQIIDITGRVLFTRDVETSYYGVSTDVMAPGVYVLRLINGDQVRTQKMIID